MTNRFLRITFILAGLVLLFPVAGTAETPLPVIHEPEGEGVKCVEPEAVSYTHLTLPTTGSWW